MSTQIYGYHNRLLHLDLEARSGRIAEPEPSFMRLYAGGGLLATYHLL